MDDHSTYAGLPMFRFDQDRLRADAHDLPELPPAGDVAWCVASIDGDDVPFPDVWRRFCASVDTARVKTVVFGHWAADDIGGPLPLVEDAASFPSLRSLFLGANVDDEFWDDQGDISPILRAFPDLERLDVTGSDGLAMEPVESGALKVLRFESCGLPAEIVRAVGASGLPNLRHLDLWLGRDLDGDGATVADLAPILSGERLPALRHLGLENSEIADEIAEAVASAPVVARLESLSLALGMLTDPGAEALLAGQPLTHLRKLGLHRNFLSDETAARVRAGLPGVDVDLSDQEEPDEYAFQIAITE